MNAVTGRTNNNRAFMRAYSLTVLAGFSMGLLCGWILWGLS